MRKLRLNLEALEVESFDTADAEAARGTVLGNEEYTWSCETAPECRTGGHASCAVTRCIQCSTSDPATTDCPITSLCA